MSAIILPTSFSDTDLPVDQDLKTYLLAQAALSHWWQADAASVVLSGSAIQSWTDLKTGSPINAAGTANKASLVTDAAFGIDETGVAYKVASFTAGTDMSASIAGLDLSGVISIVGFIKRTDVGSPGAVFGQPAGGGAAGTEVVCVNAATVQFFHRSIGSPGINIASPQNGPDATPILVTTSFNGTDTIKGQVNNGPVASATGVATAAPVAPGYIGRSGGVYMRGEISDIMIFNVDLLAPANAALLANMKAYFTGTYSWTPA